MKEIFNYVGEAVLYHPEENHVSSGMTIKRTDKPVFDFRLEHFDTFTIRNKV